MTDDDAELVALIDNELDEDRRSALLARLAADEELRRRYDELREAGAPIAASLDALLEQAPLARLRAMLPTDGPIRQPSGRFGGIALRELAAGIVIGLLAAGAAAWVALSLGLPGEREDWRMAVLEYAELYTNETFAPIHPEPSLQALELSGLSAQVGVELTPEKLALPGLRFTTGFILSYDGSPLALIAYVDSKAPRFSSASSPTGPRTLRRARKSAGIFRWPIGRAAGIAFWCSPASPRSRWPNGRKRSKKRI